MGAHWVCLFVRPKNDPHARSYLRDEFLEAVVVHSAWANRRASGDGDLYIEDGSRLDEDGRGLDGWI